MTDMILLESENIFHFANISKEYHRPFTLIFLFSEINEKSSTKVSNICDISVYYMVDLQ